MLALGVAHEHKCAHMIFKGASIKSKTNSSHVGDLPKRPTTRRKIEPLDFSRVGPESGQPRVIGLEYLVVSFGTRKCKFQHVLFHLEE